MRICIWNGEHRNASPVPRMNSPAAWSPTLLKNLLKDGFGNGAHEAIAHVFVLRSRLLGIGMQVVHQNKTASKCGCAFYTRLGCARSFKCEQKRASRRRPRETRDTKTVVSAAAHTSAAERAYEPGSSADGAVVKLINSRWHKASGRAAAPACAAPARTAKPRHPRHGIYPANAPGAKSCSAITLAARAGACASCAGRQCV